MPDKKNQSNTESETNGESKNAKPVHGWIKYFVEIFGIIGGLIGLLFLILQYLETHKDFIADQRAWIFTTEIKADTNNNNGNSAFRIEIKNSGKTPALNFRTAVGYADDIKDVPKIDVLDTNDFSVLAPDAIIITILPINNKEIEAVKHGASLWVCGINRYDDVFGSHHWSTFCWKVGTDLTTFYGTPVHNSCDDAKDAKGNTP